MTTTRSPRSIRRTFLSDERQTPREHVHEVRQPVRMGRTVKLANVHHIVLIFQNGRFVVVHVEIVRSGEYRDQTGKTGALTFLVHAIAKASRPVTSTTRENDITRRLGLRAHE